MTKELRRLSILVLAMFLALFASVTVIQGVQADTLAENPHNTRTRLDSYEVQRGAIVASGSAIASSTPVADKYAFQRVYADPDLWAPVTGSRKPNAATRPKAVPGRCGRWSAWGWRVRPRCPPGRSTRKARNGSASPWRLPATRTCCCSTNPPPA